MAITAQMVRELREMTGAAMMDCKKALEASGGDVDAAIDHLRKQGLKSAAKKADRETAEGRVIAPLSDDVRRAHLLGLACETDFLASSEGFRDLVARLEVHVRESDPTGVEEGERPLLSQPFQGEGTVGDVLQAAVGKFGENVRVVALERLESPEGRVGAYVHHDGKQGAIVAVATEADEMASAEPLKSLCQHVLVFHPSYASREEVPAEAVERERAVIAESDEVRTKPEAVRGKIVEGRLSKFYAQTVLAEQPWILDDKRTVQKALEEALGAGTRILAFRRVRLGA